jgi:DNA-binding transcriptional regulator WhiA
LTIRPASGDQLTASAGPRPIERPDRDLVAAVRAELAAIEPARRCCRAAERAGLGHAATGRARSPVVGRLAIRLLDAEGGFEWESAATHCRICWLRGVFLARGSLSLARGRTHLELVVPIEDAPVLARRLADLGVPAAVRTRRGRGVVTSKSSEEVLSLLRRLGSTAAALDLESRLVGRALRGHMNRVLNAETANLTRSVVTARRQLADIEALDQAGALARMPAAVRAVAAARRAAPAASFTELADELGTSRAAVQRAFELIADRARDDAARPAGR